MKISVIVPCYNVAPWLPACLDSVLGQTFRNLEIIVIDDGSVDGTGAIIDSYAAQDARIVAIHQLNAGLVAVREKGIALATGDYIGFVDGDDTVEPDMYERLMNNALKYNAEISHCGVSFVWPDGHVDAHYGTGKIIEQDSFTGVHDLLLGEQIEPSLCNKIYAKKLVQNSCLDVTVLNNEDMLRNFILFKRARKSVYEDFCGYRYFQRTGSMSKDDSRIVRSFWHIEKARRLILENCTEEIYPYAMRGWLSLFINQINRHGESTDPERKNMCAECRSVLKKERRNIHYLIPRQQIAAYLIIYVPWLHRIVYRIYDCRR
jgi:glycosyltransferase involved in cell wall biosynthesis